MSKGIVHVEGAAVSTLRRHMSMSDPEPGLGAQSVRITLWLGASCRCQGTQMIAIRSTRSHICDHSPLMNVSSVSGTCETRPVRCNFSAEAMSMTGWYEGKGSGSGKDSYLLSYTDRARMGSAVMSVIGGRRTDPRWRRSVALKICKA